MKEEHPSLSVVTMYEYCYHQYCLLLTLHYPGCEMVLVIGGGVIMTPP